MNLPNDPIMLLSVVNTKLRDNSPSLSELASACMTTEEEITEKLATVNYHYDKNQNQFI